jgi:hypothetical protein
LSNNSPDIEFNTTSGESGSPFNCDSCGCSVSEEDVCCAGDGYHCESCYCENFFHCESCEESCDNSERERVLGTDDAICQYCVTHSADICELETEYLGAGFAHIDSCVIDEDGFAHHVDSDTYFYSSVDDEIYNNDDLADVPTQRLTHTQALEFYTLTIAIDELTLDRTRVYTLKPWLELDSCGAITNNQLELEL